MFTPEQIERIKQDIDFDRIIAERIARRLAARTNPIYDPVAIARLAGAVQIEVTLKVNPDLIDTLMGKRVPEHVRRMSLRTEDFRLDQDMELLADRLVRLLLSEVGKENDKKTRRQLRIAAIIAVQKKITWIKKNPSH